MERRRAQRIKKRVTCEVRVGQDSHRGIVLDVSQTGLFVQTSVRIAPGTIADLIVHPSDGPEFLVRAVVARQKQTDPRLVTVVSAGVGLQILEAPEAYYRDLLGEAKGSEKAPPRRKRAPMSTATPTPVAGAGTPEQKPFRVMVRKGSRQKTVKLEAEDEAAARRAALAKQGEGWEVVEVNAG